jgi:hypothetical protein
MSQQRTRYITVLYAVLLCVVVWQGIAFACTHNDCSAVTGSCGGTSCEYVYQSMNNCCCNRTGGGCCQYTCAYYSCVGSNCANSSMYDAIDGGPSGTHCVGLKCQ